MARAASSGWSASHGLTGSSAFAASGLIWPLFLLGAIFNVALPKGGIIVYGLPVTLGYMLIAWAARWAASPSSAGAIYRSRPSCRPSVCSCRWG
ncbi:hypothetical protein [Croceicoccus marinus]|jgi:hypothetical protein|uniref:Uncharacterized protein n=1 Tax=Croceicoccus marinus TaxID=450378 RepID=A0A7G6VUY2_9SPHN|nr:hypothetical protein [Croceicoccus marinus]QNE05547.1 hypothetical protein H4O24_02275 [Croceicoccus marinus]